MCPKCFNNFLQVCLILVIGILIPVIGFFVSLIITPALGVFLGPIGIAADVILILSVIIGICAGYALDAFLIIRLYINNKQ